EVLGVFVFAGLDIYATILEDGHTFIQAVYMNGAPIEKHKLYTLATADTFTFGDLFPAIRRAKNKAFFMPEFLRDVLKQTLIDTYGHYIITPYLALHTVILMLEGGEGCHDFSLPSSY